MVDTLNIPKSVSVLEPRGQKTEWRRRENFPHFSQNPLKKNIPIPTINKNSALKKGIRAKFVGSELNCKRANCDSRFNIIWFVLGRLARDHHQTCFLASTLSAVCCSELCVAVCCSVLQCVAVRRSVLALSTQHTHFLASTLRLIFKTSLLFLRKKCRLSGGDCQSRTSLMYQNRGVAGATARHLGTTAIKSHHFEQAWRALAGSSATNFEAFQWLALGASSRFFGPKTASRHNFLKKDGPPRSLRPRFFPGFAQFVSRFFPSSWSWHFFQASQHPLPTSRSFRRGFMVRFWPIFPCFRCVPIRTQETKTSIVPIYCSCIRTPKMETKRWWNRDAVKIVENEA